MRHLTKGKGNSERAHKPASNGVFPHVASPLKGRVVSHQIWGMLPFCPICVSFSLQWGKKLEATMRVGKPHILGPKSHVSIASLVERILAVAMEIWNHECGPFWPNSLFLPLYAILELPYLHGARDPARKKGRLW